MRKRPLIIIIASVSLALTLLFLNLPRTNDKIEGCRGSARCFTGVVKGVVDGDTLDVGDFRIRLTLVNTPETGEPGYAEAKRFIESLCPAGSQALVDEDDGQRQGSFGRVIAVVYCRSRNLNSELLAGGYAKILSQFCPVSEFRSEDWARKAGC